MREFGFMLLKLLRPSLLITLIVSAVSAVLLCFAAYKGYVFDDEYKEVFSQLDNDTAYTVAAENTAQFQTESDKLAKDINDYINSRQKYGEPPVVLPDGLAGKAVRAAQKGGENSTADKREMYAFMQVSLSESTDSERLINERLSGFSRNAKRGVTDDYSLALSGVLTQDYNKVLDKQAKADKLYDTRAANAFTEYAEQDKLIFALVFLLLFSSFSGERQSRRLAAFAVTKSGAGRFILCRMLAYSVICLVCAAVYYLSLFAVMYSTGGAACLDMPVQYLKGYALSSYPFSFGGFCVCALMLKLLCVLMLCPAVMLLSFLCRRNIIAGLVCLGVPALMAGLMSAESDIAAFASCRVSFMLGGEGYIRIADTPYPFVCLYIVSALFVSVILHITLYAQSLRREF